MTVDREVGYAEVPQGQMAVVELGSGSPTVVVVPGMLSHVDFLWDDPAYARWMSSMSGRHRVLTYDPVGLGGSGPLTAGSAPNSQDELSRVIDLVDDEVIVIAWASGCAVAVSAASNSAVQRVILYAPYAVAPSLPWTEWGTGAVGGLLCPSRPDDALWSRLEQVTASPGAVELMRDRVEEGAVGPTIGNGIVVLAPTRSGICDVSPGAVYIDTADALPWGDAAADVARHSVGTAHNVGTGTRRRALVALLISDIVGSTTRATSTTGADWKHRLESHDAVITARVHARGGYVCRHTGDGIVAVFDLASDAVACAREVAEEAARVGLPARVGVHAGEVEMVDDIPEGVTARLATQVAASGGAGEIVVSATVREALAGVSIAVEPAGVCTLDGWGDLRLYRVAPL